MFGYNEWERDACEPDWRSQRSELSSIVERLLGTLTPLEEKVLRYRFGLGVRDEYTLSTTAVFVGKNSVERVRVIEAKALRKLRHPRRADRLRVFVDPPKGSPPPHPKTKAVVAGQERRRLCRAAASEYTEAGREIEQRKAHVKWHSDFDQQAWWLLDQHRLNKGDPSRQALIEEKIRQMRDGSPCPFSGCLGPRLPWNVKPL